MNATLPADPPTSSTAFADLPATPERSALRLEYQWLNPSDSTAPLLVFLHEGLGSVAMWKQWPQTLCDALGYRGLVYSRPGYGRSTPRPHGVKWPVSYMHEQAREILPALLDALDVSSAERARMWLIGHSDGASIALLYAAMFPRALAGAVVLAPHAFIEDRATDSIAQAKVAYQQGKLREALSRYHDDVDSAFYGWNDIWLNPAFRAWRIVDELAAIERPLLAVQGSDDEYGTMEQIALIPRAVPHAATLELPGVRHSAHRDAPAALNAAIVQFIQAAAR